MSDPVMAIAALAVAAGLTRDQAARLWEILQDRAAPLTVVWAYDDLSEALSQIKAEGVEL
jgi:hypothetical protein